MDFSAKGVKTPCVRTRAWLVRTRKSTRESWRGTTTDWRRRCSRSSTERSLSFTNLCCRSTLTGRTQHCVCVRERLKGWAVVCVYDYKICFGCEIKWASFFASGKSCSKRTAWQGSLGLWGYVFSLCPVWCVCFVCALSTLCWISQTSGLLELCSRKENLISECLLYRNTVHLIPLITSSPTVEEAKPPTQTDQEFISVYSFNYWKLWSHDAFVNPISVITHKVQSLKTLSSFQVDLV